jgi:hypothetical protein
MLVMRILLSVITLLIAVSAPAAEVLPFIEDDFQAAVARARAKNAPIFVEAWAPW